MSPEPSTGDPAADGHPLVELQESVLARLLALSARLDAVAGQEGNRTVRRRIAETVEGMEAIAAELRGSILELTSPASAGAIGVRLTGLVRDAGARLGCLPRVDVHGPVDDSVDDELAGELIAAAEEALRNVVQHSYAGSIEVSLTADDEAITLTVRDDGVGPNDESAAGTGLARQAAVAEARGGTCTVEPNRPLGTTFCWRVPRP